MDYSVWAERPRSVSDLLPMSFKLETLLLERLLLENQDKTSKDKKKDESLDSPLYLLYHHIWCSQNVKNTLIDFSYEHYCTVWALDNKVLA